MTSPADPARLEPVLDSLKPWLSRPNIVGLGIGPKISGGRETGDTAVLVFVERKLDRLSGDHFPVPSTVPLERLGADGELSTLDVPTDVQQVGVNEVEVLNQRVRPVPGGYQINAENLGGTGTLGVNIDWAGRYRAMTNNHVIAKNGNLGAAVYQPDKANDNAIGTVDGYTPVTTYRSDTQPNPLYMTQDLAWAYVTTRVGSPDIHLIGRPTGMRAPVPGERIKLIGKQTGRVQQATITDITTKLVVKWAPTTDKPWAYFERLVRLDGVYTQAGDSGSAYVATSDMKVVALHVGGNTSFSFGCQLWPY
jgi:hypothetical protein